MAIAAISNEVARLLIERDTNWSRFQRFCVDLMSEAERADYLPVAFRADLGRDGRTVFVSNASLEAIVCCSVKLVATDAIAKAKQDLDRLVETGLPRRVALCYTCELTETDKEKIMTHARRVATNCRVRVEGVEYLATAGAERHSQVIVKHYSGELCALRHSLLADSTGLVPSASGLRIAIATQFGQDAAALRMAAMKNLLRLTLRRKNWNSRSDLRDRVSAELGLAQKPNEAYLDHAINELLKAKEIEIKDGAIRLQSKGEDEANGLLHAARHRLLDGRAVFQEELNQRLSRNLNERTFDDLWVGLQDALADQFMHEGMSVVRAILDPAQRYPDGTNNKLLADLAMSLAAQSFSKTNTKALADAMVDVLAGDTKTRAWLSQVAATFISICALGLHPQAQEELLDRLSSWALLVDTHVVLSFLCDAEHDHEGIVRVIGAWRQLRREVATCHAVLEEASYHAFIANQVFEEYWRELPKLSRDQLSAAILNAFVRSFHQVGQSGGLGRRRWKAFISNYQGKDEFDGAQLQEILAEKGWNIIDDTSFGLSDVQKLEKQIVEGGTLRRVSLRSGKASVERRHEWDARVAMAAQLRSQQQTQSGGKTIVVTKSRAIRKAADLLGVSKGTPLSVMSVGALGYAMALTPGLSISLVDIRELLFDRTKLAQAFGHLEAVVRRIAARDREEGYDLIRLQQMQRQVDRAVLEEFQQVDREVTLASGDSPVKVGTRLPRHRRPHYRKSERA
jgi:hypothetical protein